MNFNINKNIINNKGIANGNVPQNKTINISNQGKILLKNHINYPQLQQQSPKQIQQQFINQGKKNWNNDSPKFLKYFFKDCQNQEKMTTLVEQQKRQIEETNNYNSVNKVSQINNEQIPSNQIQLNKYQDENQNQNSIINNQKNTKTSATFTNQINNPLDFSKIYGLIFSSPIMPNIPPDFQTKTQSFDVTELIECLEELKPVNIIIGKKKNSNSHINVSHEQNLNDWNVFEQDVINLIKKYSTEGYKALLMLDYKQSLICLKKSEILMNAYASKEGKIDSEILLFIKANLGICFYRIGLLQEAYSNFCICLAFLKKQNVKFNDNNNDKNSKSNIQTKSNSYQNIIPNQYKKRSYSNLPSIDQAEYLQILAQKLKKKKLKGNLLLQTCIVLSEQGKHEEALIVGNKASQLQLNYIIDTLAACYHIILQMIKERDQIQNNEDGSLQKAQTSRRGNSAHQPIKSSSHNIQNFNDQQIKNNKITENIFDGDFVQELQSPLQPFSAGNQKGVNLRDKISHLEQLIPILKEVMKRTQDLHAQYVNPSKLKILEVMNKIINNSNLIQTNQSKLENHEQSSKSSIQNQINSSTNTSIPHQKLDKDKNENHWQFEFSLYERPDLEFLFKTITSSSHWILKTNILSLLQLKGISFDDTQVNKVSIDQEICIDAILNKLSHLCVSFYCISTETRFINDQKKNKQKENPQSQNQQSQSNNSQLQNQSKYNKFLQNLNYEVSESENWLSRSLEIAYVFLPHDMPLVGQIVSVHNKFHNVNKIVIKEDENEHIEDEEEIQSNQSYDEEQYSYSNKSQLKNKVHINKNHNYYCSEYSSPLVTLPGGSKSNFFIPLVRKIKPKIVKYPSPKNEIEEEINQLYTTYTSNFVQPISGQPLSQTELVSSPKKEKSDKKKKNQSQSLHESSSYNHQKNHSQQLLEQKLTSQNLQIEQSKNNINVNPHKLASEQIKKQIAEEIQIEFKENLLNCIKQNQDPLKIQKLSQNMNCPKSLSSNPPKNQLQHQEQNKNKKINLKVHNTVQQQIFQQLSNTTPVGMMQVQQNNQQQSSQKSINSNQNQFSAQQNIQRLSKTDDLSQQSQKHLTNENSQELKDQDECDFDEFVIINQNPQVFLQNILQQTLNEQNQQKSIQQQQNQNQQNQKQNISQSQNQMLLKNNNNLFSNQIDNHSNLQDTKYDHIRKSQERKLQDKYHQQYMQLMQQRNTSVEKRQNSQEQKKRSSSNSSTSQGISKNSTNNMNQCQQLQNKTNMNHFINLHEKQQQIVNVKQISRQNSGEKKKKRVLSLAQETSSSNSQQSLQGLMHTNGSSYQTPSNSNQINIEFTNELESGEQTKQEQQKIQQNSQQKQLKKIVQKPLSAERNNKNIDTTLLSVKNLQNNNNFINNINLLLDSINYPSSAKNSSNNNNTSNQNSARQQVKQLSQTFEVKRKGSQGNTISSQVNPPVSKTSRSNSFNKTAKQNSNQSNNQIKNQKSSQDTSSSYPNTIKNQINNSFFISKNQNSSKTNTNSSQNTNEVQKSFKNNYISDHILNEISDINNTIKPNHNRGQSLQIQISQASPSSQAHQLFLKQQQVLVQQQQLQVQQQQLMQQQQLLQNTSNFVQLQLINQLNASNNNNSKRLNSKENIERSSSNNQTIQRKNKKNLDIQVNQHMIALDNTNQDSQNVFKSSRNSRNPSYCLSDNYANIYKGSQSTKSSQNPNHLLNQSSSLANEQSSQPTINTYIDQCNMVTNNAPGIINMNMLSKNQTPKYTNINSTGCSSTTASVVSDKKLHMLRKFRSSVGKVPEDLFKKK